MEGEKVFRWVRAPNLGWELAQIGPELFTVRLIGTDVLFPASDFEMGPIVEKPTAQNRSD